MELIGEELVFRVVEPAVRRGEPRAFEPHPLVGAHTFRLGRDQHPVRVDVAEVFHHQLEQAEGYNWQQGLAFAVGARDREAVSAAVKL